MIPQSYIIIQQSNPTIQIEDRDVVVVNYSTVKGDQGDPGETFIPSEHAADIVAALAGQISNTSLDATLQSRITVIETKANSADTNVALLQQADVILQASIDDHAQRIVAAEGSIVSLDGSVLQLGSDLSALDGVVSGQAGAIQSLTTRVTSAEGDIDAQAVYISGLSARIDNQDSTIAGQVVLLNSTIADVSVIDGIVTAQGTDISTLQATVGDHTSYIEIEQSVRAATIAADWNSLTTYGIGQTVQYQGSVYTSKQANNLNHSPSDIAWWGVSGNLYAQYTVKVGAGGKIAGFGLAASDTSPSVFEVLADRFAIANNSGGQTTYPFVVGDVGGVSTVGINGNLVIDGTLVVGDNVVMGENATISWQKVTDSDLAGNQDGFLKSVGGGQYRTTTHYVAGAIRIVLPANPYYSPMMKFFVDIFEYAAGYSCTLEIAGYVEDSVWYNVTARVVGASNVEYPVRFGISSSKPTVWIGNAADTWSYPQITVRDVSLGFMNTSKEMWEQGWVISFDTAAQTFTEEVLDTLPGADWSKVARIPGTIMHTTTYIDEYNVSTFNVYAENIYGTTITGKTLRTSESGARFEVTHSDNKIFFYNSAGNKRITVGIGAGFGAYYEGGNIGEDVPVFAGQARDVTTARMETRNGIAIDGYAGNTGIAVRGLSVYGYGMIAGGLLSPLQLVPSTSGAPTHYAYKGSLWVDVNGILYINVGGSNVWQKVGAQ